MKYKSIAILLLMFLLVSCGETTVQEEEKPPMFALTDEPLALITEPGTLPQQVQPSGTAAANPEETVISFAAAGDNIAHDSVVATAKAAATGSAAYDFSGIYADIKPLISAADLAFVNQEAPVGGAEFGISGYPNFNAPHEMVEGLMDAGFDIFNIANNHMLDKGERGYIGTVNYFSSLPVMMVGGYTKSDYDSIRTIECKGVKIAVLAYTTLVNYGHINDIAANSKYLIPYAKDADIERQVALAKQAADVVIVSFHWGTEDEFSVTKEQQHFAKLCADLGVDVVLGHHPHVIGNVKWVSGESGNQTLVAYSLGNLCSTMLYGKNMVGEILTFDIVKGKNGAISIERPLVHPVVSHYQTDTGKTDNQGLAVRYDAKVYLMKNYTDALANSHGANVWGKFSFADLKKIVTDMTDTAFLPDFLK